MWDSSLILQVLALLLNHQVLNQILCVEETLFISIFPLDLGWNFWLLPPTHVEKTTKCCFYWIACEGRMSADKEQMLLVPVWHLTLRCTFFSSDLFLRLATKFPQFVMSLNPNWTSTIFILCLQNLPRGISLAKLHYLLIKKTQNTLKIQNVKNTQCPLNHE